MGVIVLCDTEYTTDEGWGGLSENPDPALPRHIVQIGALKLDAATLDILGEYDSLCKPPIPLTSYFTRLTGIRQQDVDEKGMAFPELYSDFRRFWPEGMPFYSNGSDIDVLRRNFEYHAMPLPAAWPDLELSNIRSYLHRHAPETKGVNSGRLTEALGIRPKHMEHTGLADCHSIREAVLYLMRERGAPSPFL